MAGNIACFVIGAMVLLCGVVTGVAVIVIWRDRMYRPAPPRRRQAEWRGEENTPRGAHVGRWNG